MRNLRKSKSARNIEYIKISKFYVVKNEEMRRAVFARFEETWNSCRMEVNACKNRINT